MKQKICRKFTLWKLGLWTIGFSLSAIACESHPFREQDGKDAPKNAKPSLLSPMEPTSQQIPPHTTEGPVDGPNTDSQIQKAERLSRLASLNVPDDAETKEIILKDAEDTENGFIYVTLNHLAQGEKASELEIYRFGVTKTLNSVSTRPQIVGLKALDPAESIFKVKLSDFALSENNFRSILLAPGAKDAHSKLANKSVVQGDWLVYALTRPEIYDHIMRLPNTISNLESQLKLSGKRVSAEVGEGLSTVTFGRRTLIRQDANVGGEPGGYYWRSIDYFGPLVAGEFFFSLPNGLQGYMLSGFATQHRIDAQPFVATDFRRSQDGLTRCVGNAKTCGYVINGESCMTCHENGVNINKNIDGFQGTTGEGFEALVKQDSERFMKAIAKMGFDTIKSEPIKTTLSAFRKRTKISDKRILGSEINPVSPVGGIFAR